MGSEDWDFWIRAFMLKKQFHYIPELGFKYRVREESMLRTITVNHGDENRKYIYSKHHLALFESIHKNYDPNPENYKSKYIELIQSLMDNKLKSIAKLLLGRKFV